VREDTGVTPHGVSLVGKNIILAVSGGIAATESIKLARELRRHGANVFPMMSKSAEKVITPLALSWGSGVDVVTDWDPKMSQLRGFDGLILAPATRNTIAKFAHGLLDSPMMMALSAAVGSGIPTLFVPSMHNDLFDDAVTTELLSSLEELSVAILTDKPSEGRRKQPSVTAIVAEFCNMSNSRLEGRKRVAVTLGGNSAPIDSVRSIVNTSTGNTGWSIAEHLHRMGHDVVCIVGRTTREPSFSLPDVRYDETPEGMLLESIELANSTSEPEYWIHAAAILDYVPDYINGKMPSKLENWNIELTPTKKHLQELKEHVADSKRIGFKLEVDADEDAIFKKSMDLISANNLEAVVANLLDEVRGNSPTRCRMIFSNGVVKRIADLRGLCEAIEDLISSD